MKKRAYLVHSGGGDSYQFHGVFPDQLEASKFARRVAFEQRWVEGRNVTRRELENLKEDDVADSEWDEYGDAP